MRSSSVDGKLTMSSWGTRGPREEELPRDPGEVDAESAGDALDSLCLCSGEVTDVRRVLNARPSVSSNMDTSWLARWSWSVDGEENDMRDTPARATRDNRCAEKGPRV